MVNKNKKLRNNKKLWHSQNFLHSTKLVSDLLQKSSINKDDTVIEIGPGKGIITKQLAKQCKKVYAIEYDFCLYEKLKHLFGDTKNVEIIYGDFLKTDIPSNDKYKVFSSIPYNITAEILSRLTSVSNIPENSYIILQEEAARKYAGDPYNKESMRSLLLKPYFDFKIIYRLKNTDFTPVPKVNSVMLHIEKRSNALVESQETDLYKDFISYIFKMKGRNLRERLKYIFSNEQLKRLSKNIEFKITDSPTDLNFKQWLKVFQYFIIGVSSEKQKLVYGCYSKFLNEQKKINKIHRNRKSYNKL